MLQYKVWIEKNICDNTVSKLENTVLNNKESGDVRLVSLALTVENPRNPHPNCVDPVVTWLVEVNEALIGKEVGLLIVKDT